MTGTKGRELLPRPVAGARKALGLSQELVAAVFPPLGSALRFWTEKSRQNDVSVLADALEKRGYAAIADLDEGQREWLLPQTYRFLEQIRLSEYRHNLKVVADVIAGGLIDYQTSDSGRSIRAARRLEMLGYEELVAIGKLPSAFQLAEKRSTMGPRFNALCCIEPCDLEAVLQKGDPAVDNYKCQEWLHELATRGVLTAGGSAQHVGGIFYYRCAAYDEIIDSVECVLASDTEADQ